MLGPSRGSDGTLTPGDAAVTLSSRLLGRWIHSSTLWMSLGYTHSMQ